MRVDLIEAAPGWADHLSSIRHDFYHLPSYVAFASRQQDVGRPMAFVAEEGEHRFLAPIIVRPIPPEIAGGLELFDATCPHGYPGPVVGPQEPDVGFVTQAVDALRETLRERSIISAFFRLHPLLLPPLEPLAASGTVVEHGMSISIDLGLTQDELWRQTRENHRRDIGRAARLGHVARIDGTWERFDGFIDVYQQSMERLGAAAFWRLPRGYFDDLRESLGDRLHLCVVEVDGRLAAAGLLTEVDGIVEYHLAGTATEFVNVSPSKLLIDFARSWAKERGNRVLHLAGSVRSGDPLYQFKLGFSPASHPVYSWRLVTDPSAYASLIDRWETGSGAVADQPDGYFPAYRKSSVEAIDTAATNP